MHTSSASSAPAAGRTVATTAASTPAVAQKIAPHSTGLLGCFTAAEFDQTYRNVTIAPSGSPSPLSMPPVVAAPPSRIARWGAVAAAIAVVGLGIGWLMNRGKDAAVSPEPETKIATIDGPGKSGQGADVAAPTLPAVEKPATPDSPPVVQTPITPSMPPIVAADPGPATPVPTTQAPASEGETYLRIQRALEAAKSAAALPPAVPAQAVTPPAAQPDRTAPLMGPPVVTTAPSLPPASVEPTTALPPVTDTVEQGPPVTPTGPAPVLTNEIKVLPPSAPIAVPASPPVVIIVTPPQTEPLSGVRLPSVPKLGVPMTDEETFPSMNDQSLRDPAPNGRILAPSAPIDRGSGGGMMGVPSRSNLRGFPRLESFLPADEKLLLPLAPKLLERRTAQAEQEPAPELEALTPEGDSPITQRAIAELRSRSSASTRLSAPVVTVRESALTLDHLVPTDEDTTWLTNGLSVLKNRAPAAMAVRERKVTKPSNLVDASK